VSAAGSPDPDGRRLEPDRAKLRYYSTRVFAKSIHGGMEATMMKGGLLWLIGIPIPIILILFFLGYLH
jgi:hypothetical protein